MAIDGPIDGDQGRLVLYGPSHGAIEEGAVTSWNSAYVFVHFNGDTHPKACRREDLEWTFGHALSSPTEKGGPGNG